MQGELHPETKKPSAVAGLFMLRFSVRRLPQVADFLQVRAPQIKIFHTGHTGRTPRRSSASATHTTASR